MANCRYELKNGQKFDSFADLLNNFVDREIKDFNSLSDVIFSKYKKRDDLREQIITVNKEYIPKKRISDTNSAISTIVDGEPAIRESDVIGISEWIDHPSCVINNEPLIRQFIKKDYVESEIDVLVSKGMDEEDAKKAVQTILNSWKTIEEDSMVLHSLFTSNTIGNLVDFENAAELTKRMSI